jgi:hypothetical protein
MSKISAIIPGTGYHVNWHGLLMEEAEGITLQGMVWDISGMGWDIYGMVDIYIYMYMIWLIYMYMIWLIYMYIWAEIYTVWLTRSLEAKCLALKNRTLFRMKSNRTSSSLLPVIVTVRAVHG